MGVVKAMLHCAAPLATPMKHVFYRLMELISASALLTARLTLAALMGVAAPAAARQDKHATIQKLVFHVRRFVPRALVETLTAAEALVGAVLVRFAAPTTRVSQTPVRGKAGLLLHSLARVIQLGVMLTL